MSLNCSFITQKYIFFGCNLQTLLLCLKNELSSKTNWFFHLLFCFKNFFLLDLGDYDKIPCLLCFFLPPNLLKRTMELLSDVLLKENHWFSKIITLLQVKRTKTYEII